MNLKNAENSRCTFYNARTQLWDFLKERVSGQLRFGKNRLAAIDSENALSAHRAELRTFFLKQIGGLPTADARYPLVREAGVVHKPDYTIRKIILETRPQVFASANLYLPESGGQPAPALLFLSGHCPDAKAGPRYQAICQKFARRGFVVLALDPAGQGERLNYLQAETGRVLIRPGTGDHEYAGVPALLMGQNLTRYLLHDAMQAVSFLVGHPDVDATRIGVTGSSGGGTQTALMMALDDRLAAAAPATFITTRQAIFDSGYGQDAEQIWPGFTGAGYDHADLLACFAPKPVCVLSVTYDFFPIEGTRETLAAARPVWRLFGRASPLEAVEDVSLHNYTDSLADSAADFFSRAFAYSGRPEVERRDEVPKEMLWCTSRGQILVEIPKAKSVPDEIEESYLQIRDRQGPDIPKALHFVEQAVLKNREPVDYNLRLLQEETFGDIRARTGYWWSQRGLLNSAVVLDSVHPAQRHGVLVTAVWDEGTQALTRHDFWIRGEIAKGNTVMVLNLTGMGPLEPHPFNEQADLESYYGTFFRVSDDLISLGDSFCALRAYDVLRAWDAARLWPELPTAQGIELAFSGKSGIYGLFAALVDRKITLRPGAPQLPPYADIVTGRYYDDGNIKSYLLPGLLLYADWPELLSWRLGRAQADGSAQPPLLVESLA